MDDGGLLITFAVQTRRSPTFTATRLLDQVNDQTGTSPDRSLHLKS
jgi:hypothetical protein